MAVWSRLIGDGIRLRGVEERGAVDDDNAAAVSLTTKCLVAVAEQ